MVTAAPATAAVVARAITVAGKGAMARAKGTSEKAAVREITAKVATAVVMAEAKAAVVVRAAATVGAATTGAAITTRGTELLLIRRCWREARGAL